MKYALTIITAILILAGCGENEQKTQLAAQETKTFKTIQYYLDHKDLRKVRLKECDNMKEMTEVILHDCNNAKTAEYKSHKNKLMEF